MRSNKEIGHFLDFKSAWSGRKWSSDTERRSAESAADCSQQRLSAPRQGAVIVCAATRRQNHGRGNVPLPHQQKTFAAGEMPFSKQTQNTIPFPASSRTGTVTSMPATTSVTSEILHQSH
jgi:hypothetical protein